MYACTKRWGHKLTSANYRVACSRNAYRKILRFVSVVCGSASPAPVPGRSGRHRPSLDGHCFLINLSLSLSLESLGLCSLIRSPSRNRIIQVSKNFNGFTTADGTALYESAVEPGQTQSLCDRRLGVSVEGRPGVPDRQLWVPVGPGYVCGSPHFWSQRPWVPDTSVTFLDPGIH
jgi:hypothetical protein